MNTTPKCRKCNGNTKESKALVNTQKSVDDFGNDKDMPHTTIIQTSNAKLIDCLKCVDCGHCFTVDSTN